MDVSARLKQLMKERTISIFGGAESMKEKTIMAQRLQSLRKSNGLTQARLAEAVNLRETAIRSYENGLREPNSKAMAALEQYFGVSGAYLRGEADDPGPCHWEAQEKSVSAVRLQQLRKERGLTQKQLSEQLCISVETLINYENGRREPGAAWLGRLELFFGVSGAYIMGLTDERQLTNCVEQRDEAVERTSHPVIQDALPTERRLVQYYRRLDEQQQDILLGWAAELAGLEDRSRI